MKNWSETKKSRYLAYLMIILFTLAVLHKGADTNDTLITAFFAFWGGSVATGTLLTRDRKKKETESLVEETSFEEEGEE